MKPKDFLDMKPKNFRVFVTNKYYENREEYEASSQEQPYSFVEFVSANLSLLKYYFKLSKKG